MVFVGGADKAHIHRNFLRYVAAAGRDVSPGGYIERYHELLTDPDPAVHGPAGIAWTTWEAATSTLLRDQEHIDEVQDGLKFLPLLYAFSSFYASCYYGSRLQDASQITLHQVQLQQLLPHLHRS